MKKAFGLTVLLILVLTLGLAVAKGYDASSSATTSSESGYSSGGVMKTLGKERVFTRNGPATGFYDTGTYTVKGGNLRAYSYACDKSGAYWAQCDFSYKGKLRRLYTRLEAIDSDYFDLDGIPLEQPLNYKAKVKSVSRLYYGPGGDYDAHGNNFKSTKGSTVYIIAIEDEYAQVEWTTAKSSYRVWIPITALDY